MLLYTALAEASVGYDALRSHLAPKGVLALLVNMLVKAWINF